MIPLKEHIAIGLLRSEDKILLVKQAYDLHLWTLPGGDVEPGESFADAVIREFKEETGLDVKVQGIVVVRDRPDQICIVFAVEACGGELLESVPGEVEGVKWFDLDTVNQGGQAIIDSSRSILLRVLQSEVSVLGMDRWKSRDGLSADLFMG